jgi:hypothetical protein
METQKVQGQQLKVLKGVYVLALHSLFIKKKKKKKKKDQGRGVCKVERQCDNFRERDSLQ